MRKHNILPIFAALLLLTACGESQSPVATDGNVYASDGNYATDGNVYATDGNYFYYAEAYTTEGNAYDYSVQNLPYATNGNVDRSALKTVRVSTVDELLNALAPATEVLLSPGEYNLSQCTPALYSNCYFHPTFPLDGETANELVLCNLYDCVIASESGKCEDVTIVAEPRTAAVLTIEDSCSIQLRGLTLGHTEGAICSAAVITLRNSGSVYIEDCELYGCGTIGLNCSGCRGVTTCGSLIRDCSYNAVDLMDSESFLFRDVTFRNVGENAVFNIMNSHWVETENCVFEQNPCMSFLSEFWSDHVFFDDCRFKDNSFHWLFQILNSASPEFYGCEIPVGQCGRLYDNANPTVFALADGKELH